jgi:hypothetical protein
LFFGSLFFKKLVFFSLQTMPPKTSRKTSQAPARKSAAKHDAFDTMLNSWKSAADRQIDASLTGATYDALGIGGPFRDMAVMNAAGGPLQAALDTVYTGGMPFGVASAANTVNTSVNRLFGGGLGTPAALASPYQTPQTPYQPNELAIKKQKIVDWCQTNQNNPQLTGFIKTVWQNVHHPQLQTVGWMDRSIEDINKCVESL